MVAMVLQARLQVRWAHSTWIRPSALRLLPQAVTQPHLVEQAVSVAGLLPMMMQVITFRWPAAVAAAAAALAALPATSVLVAPAVAAAAVAPAVRRIGRITMSTQ